MAAIKYIKRTVALDGSSISEPLPATFFNSEFSAHTFIIAGERDKAAVAFSDFDAVSATFLNANDAVVSWTGSIVDGAAVVTLSDDCYALPGRFTLTIDVNGATVYECQSRIKRRSSGTAYDPNDELTVAALSAEIAAMRAATAAANTAATAADTARENMEEIIAPTFSATAQYHAGYYVWYNGELYQYKTNHDAGSWDATQAVKVPISKSVREMQDETRIYQYLTNNGQYTVTADDMENGGWSYSSKINNTKRVRNANLIPVRAGMQIAYSNPTLRLGFWVLPNKTSGTFAQTIGFKSAGNSGVVNITANGYLIILADGGANDITVADYDCEVKIFTTIGLEYAGKDATYYKVHFEYLQVYDADMFTDPGTYGIQSGLPEANYLNFPDAIIPKQTGGTIINVKITNQDMYFRQYYINYNDFVIYTRYKRATGFEKWTKIDLSNIDYLNGNLLTQKNVIAPFDMDYTREGMTFTASTADPNVITLNGTWDGTSVCFANIFTHTYPIQVLQAGTYYYISIDKSAEDNDLCVELFSRDENLIETWIGRFTKSDFVKIPDDAATCLLRVRYLKKNVQVTNLRITVKMLELSDISYGVYGKGPKHIIQNKKIAWFGDSIMAGAIPSEGAASKHCCSEYLQNELNIEVVDYAYGAIGYITHRYLTKNILELAKMTDLTGCTYFVCSAGDNDGSSPGYPIGNYTDTNSEFDDYAAPGSGATIIGNLYKLVDYLHHTYPNMTIIIVDKPNATKGLHSEWPTYRRTDGNWVKQLNTAFKEFCEYYGCAYISLDNMGADPWLLDELLDDEIHWTRLGYQKLMLYIAGEIRKYTGQGDYYTQYVNHVWEKYANILYPS